MLNKVKEGSNMYQFLNEGGYNGYTWNPISGLCSHNCKYCYVKIFPQKPLHLSEKALKDDLGKGNFIFIGSSTDMFAENVPSEWIRRVLINCCVFTKNKYLFQTKNPKRFKEFLEHFPSNSILGITLETDKESPSEAPLPMNRYAEFVGIGGFDKMVSLEPLIDFNLDVMIYWLRNIKPLFVSVGADSKNHHLPEPSKEKIEALITELRKFTQVKIKDNLGRLMR